MPSETSWQSVGSLAESLGCPPNEIHKAYGKGGRVRGRLLERRGLHEHERKAAGHSRAKYAYRVSPLTEKKGPGPAGAFDPAHKPAPTYRGQPGGDGANMAARAARAEFEEDFAEVASAFESAGLDLGQPGWKAPAESTEEPPASTEPPSSAPESTPAPVEPEEPVTVDATKPRTPGLESFVSDLEDFVADRSAAFRSLAPRFMVEEVPDSPEGLEDFLADWNRRYRRDVEAQKNDVFRKFTWDIAGGIVGPEIQSMAIAILREYYEGPQ